jgi:pyruvate/2-oxoglutarate dehydrogenase complex dihydrolipoamide dehydrogenase (E3) component
LQSGVVRGHYPNVEGLGLEAAGIEVGRQGVVVVDRLRTTNRRVYAAGDVSSRFQFTHAADAEARIVLQNALFHGRKKASALVVPWCTYTSPEVAHVGLSAADAAAQGVEVETVTVPLSSVDRAVLDGETDGFLRVVLARGGDRILGATLVAAHAGESIGELTLAIGAGHGRGRHAQVIHPNPPPAEAIKKAADPWRRGKLTPAV